MTVHSRTPRYVLLLALIAAGAGGLWLQYGLSVAPALGTPGRTAAIVDLLSYFTILTNILAVLALLAALVSNGRWPSSAPFTGVTVSIAMVGLVYVLVLRVLWSPAGPQFWADILLHYAMPFGMVQYWLLFVPKGRLPWHAPLFWLVYPLAYCAYALARGHVTGKYPYPFIDANVLAPLALALNIAGLAVCFLVLGYFALAIDRLIASHAKDH